MRAEQSTMVRRRTRIAERSIMDTADSTRRSGGNPAREERAVGRRQQAGVVWAAQSSKDGRRVAADDGRRTVSRATDGPEPRVGMPSTHGFRTGMAAHAVGREERFYSTDVSHRVSLLTRVFAAREPEGEGEANDA
jgi:hypothetical protein